MAVVFGQLGAAGLIRGVVGCFGSLDDAALFAVEGDEEHVEVFEFGLFLVQFGGEDGVIKEGLMCFESSIVCFGA